jgi:hypothetical protein
MHPYDAISQQIGPAPPGLPQATMNLPKAAWNIAKV